MVRLTRRLALYVGSLLALVALYTAAYRWGMAALEGEPRTWFGALEIVVQSMTTTGYGQDAPWRTLPMTVLVVLVQLTGIAYIFVAIPLFVVPWLERLVSPGAPESTEPLDGHVLIVGYTALCGSLVDELDARSVPYLIVEPDGDRARELYEAGRSVVHGDPAEDDTLEAVWAERARAVVVDATAGTYVRPILAIEEAGTAVPVIALVQDQSRARYLRYAGVEEVLSPRHNLGKAIADRIRGLLATEPAALEAVGLEVAEFPVDPDSDLIGDPIESALRIEATGATAIGATLRGEFVTDWSTDILIDETAVLLVVGTAGQLEAVAADLGVGGRPYRTDREPVVVLGGGLVAATVVGGLERAGLRTRLLRPAEAAARGGGPLRGETAVGEPDAVGDPTDEEVLTGVDIDEAGTVVIALEDDERTILASLVCRELAPDARVLATLGRTESARRLRAAGVDSILSLPSVAGRLVARTLFGGEFATMDERLQVDRVRSPAAGLDREAVRAETGCSVIGVLRDGAVETRPDRYASDDVVLVAGTASAIDRFRAYRTG